MAIAYTDEQNYIDIANSIRRKNGSTDKYLPSEMAEAIDNMLDENLIASNIRYGVTIYGITGTYIGEFATVTISGSGGNYAYLYIDGVRYNNSTTLKVLVGSNIICSVRDEGNKGNNVCGIKVDGIFVSRGASSYKYTVTRDVNINLDIIDYQVNTSSGTEEYMCGLIEVN